MGPSIRSSADSSRSRVSQEAPRLGQSKRSVKRSGRRSRPITTNNAVAESNAPYLAARSLSYIVFSAGYELAFYELYPSPWHVEISWPDPVTPEENDRDALYKDYETSDDFCFLRRYGARRAEFAVYAQPQKNPGGFVASMVPTDNIDNPNYDLVRLRNIPYRQESSDVKFQRGKRNSRTAHKNAISMESRSPSDDTGPLYDLQSAESTSGSNTLQAWKSGPGRKKDWRRCVYTGMPINGPNSGRRFHLRHKPHSQKSSVRGSRRWTMELADIQFDVDFETSMLLGLLRHEPHADLYAAEHLSEQIQLTVKAYLIRGVSKKDREYRVRNLKRLTDKPSFVGSLEQSGRKWLIFFREPAETPKPARKYCGPDRRNWSRCVPDIFLAYRPKDLSAHGTYKIMMEELEAETARISSFCSQPSLAARLISRLIESNPSWSDGKLAMSQASEARKPKSPEQIDHVRERQRLARKAKRLQKAAGKEILTVPSESLYS
ncbi:hypothetical protein MMC18_009245 [Xylographa bjoerkii]|nr:hypothetical protein [Xylographa bjoerkii]